MCVEPKPKLLALYNALVTTISFICKMQVDYLTLDSNEILNFDGELQVLQQHMQKQVVQVLDPFLSFMLSFQPHKATICWP